MNCQQKVAAGNLALTRGLYMEAQRQFVEALQEVKAAGQDDPVWGEIQRGLAQVYLQFSKPEQAYQAVQTAMQSDGHFYGPECAQNGFNWFLQGDALRMTRRFDEAKLAYEKCRRILDREYGTTHEFTVQVLSRLVTLFLEAEQEYGFEELHKEALIAFQLRYPSGSWVRFIRMRELADDYISNGNGVKAEAMLQRELNILSRLLGKNHLEVVETRKVQAELLQEQRRLLASWETSAQSVKLESRNAEQLFFCQQRDYAASMDDCRSVIERMLSMSGANTSTAPFVFNQAWWKVDTNKSNPNQIVAGLRYSDSPDNDDRKSRLKITIKLTSRMQRVHVDFNCTLSNSNRLSLARDLVQYTIFEIDQTLSILPAIVQAQANELRALSIPQGNTWPTAQQYNEAIQHPKACFGPLELREALPEVNQLGLPRPSQGTVGAVYRLGSSSGDWAIKCFLHRVTDEQARYRAISSRLADAHLPYFVPFQFISEGMRVKNDWFPLVQMNWVEGKALNAYIVENLFVPNAIAVLADNVAGMIDALLAAGIAHGDLQHGNILIVNGDPMLVDYDGMWVPELAKFKSNGTGHPNFQHPKRSQEHFGSYLDNFAGWLIYCSLRCLAEDPTLWETLQGGDDCLLLRRDDLANPQASPRLKAMLTHQNEEVREHARVINRLLALSPEKVPTFATVFSS